MLHTVEHFNIVWVLVLFYYQPEYLITKIGIIIILIAILIYVVFQSTLTRLLLKSNLEANAKEQLLAKTKKKPSIHYEKNITINNWIIIC